MMCSKNILFIALFLYSMKTFKCEEKTSFFAKIPQHLKNAVFDTSSEVSKLVSRAFKNTPTTASNDSGVVSALLKLMGLEGQKIGAIAVNSIVMVSQLIVNNFVLPADTTMEHPKTNGNNIINTIIENVLSKQGEHTELFARATKENLLNYITGDEEDTKNLSCTKLLLCKIQPFVKEMQQNVINMMRQEKKLIMKDHHYYNFPSMELLLEQFGNCDVNFSHCVYK